MLRVGFAPTTEELKCNPNKSSLTGKRRWDNGLSTCSLLYYWATATIRAMGLEPTLTGLENRDFSQLSYARIKRYTSKLSICIVLAHERIELSFQHWECCVLPLDEWTLMTRVGFEPNLDYLKGSRPHQKSNGSFDIMSLRHLSLRPIYYGLSCQRSNSAIISRNNRYYQ